MLPKAHVLFGFLFAYIVYWFTQMTILQASLILFAAIFIDFDHYLWHGLIKKDWNLKQSYDYLKDEEKDTPKLMIFHTIEFHILVGLLGLIWSGFYYLLAGMVFHSILDLISLIRDDELNLRIFFGINILIKKYR